MSNYLLEETQDETVYQWTQRVNKTWVLNLTPDQYVERERHLAMTKVCDITRDRVHEHGLRYWVFRDLSILKESGESSDLYDRVYNIVGSCETLHRDSWRFVFEDSCVRRIDVVSPCIGAVHTIDEHRGKGVCTAMMKSLMMELDNQLSLSNFITLYSEIGDYYDKFGFQQFQSLTITVPVSSVQKIFDGVSFLMFEEFGDLVNLYRTKLIESIQREISKDHKSRIALVPTVDVIEWHHARSNFLSNLFHNKLPGNFGVQVKNENGIVTGFVIFTHDYVSQLLYLVMVYAIDLPTLAKLLQAVNYEATQIGFKKIVAWETDLLEYKVLFEGLQDKEASVAELREYIENSLGGTTGLPNGSISAVRMQDSVTDVKWAGNGKWAWF